MNSTVFKQHDLTNDSDSDDCVDTTKWLPGFEREGTPGAFTLGDGSCMLPAAQNIDDYGLFDAEHEPLSLSEMFRGPVWGDNDDILLTPPSLGKLRSLEPPPFKHVEKFNRPPYMETVMKVKAGKKTVWRSLFGDENEIIPKPILIDEDIVLPLPLVTDFDLDPSLGSKNKPICLDYSKTCSTTDGMVKGQGPKAKRWCFTMNNPSMDLEAMKLNLLSDERIVGACYQLEKATTGTKHYQGYLEFDKQVYTTAVIKVLGQHAHLSVAKGTRMENINYCSKSDSRIEGPVFIGEVHENARNPKGQGARNDLVKAVAKYREEGENGLQEMIDEGADSSIRYMANIKNVANMLDTQEAKKAEMEYWVQQKERRDAGQELEGQKQRELYIYYGPTAVGKTTEIKLNTQGMKKGLYVKDGGNKWWDGYAGETTILLDEFKGERSSFSIEQFNSMNDKGAFQVEVKGGFALLKAEEIHVASNTHPADWWLNRRGEEGGWNDPRYQAVARRCKCVYWWKKESYDSLVVLQNPGKDGTEEQKRVWEHFWRGTNRNKRYEAIGGDQLGCVFTNAHTYFDF